MKKYLFILLYVLVVSPLFAQKLKGLKNEVVSYTLPVSFSTTTHLIFPEEVVYVDLGSPDLIASTADAVSNIIRVKANVKEFLPTNISVVTKAGRFYTFNALYVETLETTAFKVSDDASNEAPVYMAGVNINLDAINAQAKKIAGYKQSIKHLGQRKGKVVFSVQGMYTLNETMFVKLEIDNHSSVKYVVESLRFYMKDKKVPKRTARQEIEFEPVLIYNNTASVDSKTSKTVVVALKRFTLPDQKVFEGELREKDGGRHVKFQAQPEDMFNVTMIKN